MQPYYQDKLTTLYMGDCLEVMAGLESASFDAIIADPPYGTTACAWDSVIPFAAMWSHLKRLARPRAPIVLFGSQPFTSALIASNFEMFKYELIWNKGRGREPQLANIRPMKAHENIIVFSDSSPMYNPQKTPLLVPDKRGRNPVNGGGQGIIKSYINEPREYFDRFPISIVDFAGNQGLHPTQKPLALMEYLIRTYTNRGDTVLDFTCGSGTTLRAAKNLGRACVGIEREEHYCEVVKHRLAPEFEEAIQAPAVDLSDLPLFAEASP